MIRTVLQLVDGGDPTGQWPEVSRLLQERLPGAGSVERIILSNSGASASSRPWMVATRVSRFSLRTAWGFVAVRQDAAALALALGQRHDGNLLGTIGQGREKLPLGHGIVPRRRCS